jgi:hypothetical protein
MPKISCFDTNTDLKGIYFSLVSHITKYFTGAAHHQHLYDDYNSTFNILIFNKNIKKKKRKEKKIKL